MAHPQADVRYECYSLSSIRYVELVLSAVVCAMCTVPGGAIGTPRPITPTPDRQS